MSKKPKQTKEEDTLKIDGSFEEAMEALLKPKTVASKDVKLIRKEKPKENKQTSKD